MTTPDLLRPVLVGGTGRSGSTIVGHLLDHHPALTLTRPMEVRFIAGTDGLADALAIALAERHSWTPADLRRLTRRLGLSLCSRKGQPTPRSRTTSRTSPPGPRASRRKES